MDTQSFAALVQAKLQEVEQKAFSIFRFPIGIIRWEYNSNLPCKTAGLAYRSKVAFDLNPRYVESHSEQLLNETVPHEIGHLVCFKVYPYAKQGHGPEFRYILRRLGYPDAARTYHDYKRDDDPVKSRHPRYPVLCAKCGERMELTARMISKLHIYHHKNCGGILVSLT